MNFDLLTLELLVESQLVTLFFNYLLLYWNRLFINMCDVAGYKKVIAISVNAIEIVLYQ